MTEAASNPPVLRLVNTGVVRTHHASRRRAIRANRASAGLDPADARWVFAVRVSQTLEGGRAAILRPDRRRALLSQARAMGLRDFDAGLLIAIVQDGARVGDGALSEGVEQRVTLVRAADPEPIDWRPALVAGLMLGAALLLTLIAWVS